MGQRLEIVVGRLWRAPSLRRVNGLRHASVITLLLQDLQGGSHEVFSGLILAASQRVVNKLGYVCG